MNRYRSGMQSNEEKRAVKRILFVCHGNICRSPMAEFIFREMVSRAGRSDDFLAASAATSAEELGNPVYPPVFRMLRRLGIDASAKRARRIRKDEYGAWDHIIGMDEENRRNLLRLFDGDPDRKVSLLLDWTDAPGVISDPWYTGEFEQTLREVCLGCEALLRAVDTAAR